MIVIFLIRLPGRYSPVKLFVLDVVRDAYIIYPPKAYSLQASGENPLDANLRKVPTMLKTGMRSTPQCCWAIW